MDMILIRGRKALDHLAGLYEAVCVALLAGMLGINAVNIVCRSMLDISLNWVWPWTMVAFLYWVMLAFFPLVQRRKDVSIYFLLQYLSPALRQTLGIFVALAIMTASGLLIYTFPERLASLRGQIEIVGLPRKILIWPLVASAVPIFLSALIDAVRTARGALYEPFGVIATSEVAE